MGFLSVKAIGKHFGCFEDCHSLISLPDISKWNTSNVESMNRLFKNCFSLISLPDISKWNIFKVKNKEEMLEGFLSLINILNCPKN